MKTIELVIVTLGLSLILLGGFAGCGDDKVCPILDVPLTKQWPVENAVSFLLMCNDAGLGGDDCQCRLTHLMNEFHIAQWTQTVIDPYEIETVILPCADCK